MLDQRKKIVLNAIVRDYVATREPVGSKGIVERHKLGVSPATVRNDMSHLEEAGLIVQPHTSAGRIPTDAGYREFVDSIHDIKPLSIAERRAIEKVLTCAEDLDDVLERATRALARITGQVAIIQYPSLRRTVLRHVELVPLGQLRVLLIIITDEGRVEERTLTLNEPTTSENIATVRNIVNAQCVGKKLSDLDQALANVYADVPESTSNLAQTIGEMIVQVLAADSEEHVVVAGRKNLAQYDADFNGTMSDLLDILEEQVVLMRMLAPTQGGLAVQIGRENTEAKIDNASVVSTSYSGTNQSSVARLGIIGPTRMDYQRTMSGVHAVAKYLSDILSGTHESR
ncbi:heat-inducible transcriptional repressor HrcA [Arcanobacterium pinnipediorum]|uniref:Heat-inducible transcription repressor HrcA n=1 Tax=Arcanobacterium pinnipediorum TaxID=1503041 RepID=A0ABY5AFG2_9ACTO|nr:heat-inducible transcriptional repressor HrcA [Arcanobacterium pinnipediorum]USR78745.1 heat-inducible transcriptional repressor HrcA [Arcanobacterium pinnipediorum]